MSSRRLLIVAASGAVFIAALLIILFVLTGSRQMTYQLPEVSPPDTQQSGGAPQVNIVALDEDNVREVVATLSRPESYSRNIMIENFWEGGNSIYSFSAAVRGDMTSVKMTYLGTVKTIILRDGYVYIRYSGDDTFYKRPLDSPNDADEYQKILTYEEITSLERGDILKAELREDNGEPVIYVRWRGGELGYVTEGCVSVRLGLLISAVIWDGETMVYRMTAGDCVLSDIDDSVFEIW